MMTNLLVILSTGETVPFPITPPEIVPEAGTAPAYVLLSIVPQQITQAGFRRVVVTGEWLDNTPTVN